MNGGLDAFPSLTRLKELHRERTGRELVLDGGASIVVSGGRALVPVRRIVDAIDRLDEAAGEPLPDGGLRLVLPVAPRTKKNGRKGGFAGIKQGPAYREYRDAIIAIVAPMKAAIALPLEARPYNIAVTYYVDSHGRRADKCGLDQGLYDALENAGVVTDDFQFRTDDGTRIVAGDLFPRVELVITPIKEGSDA